MTSKHLTLLALTLFPTFHLTRACTHSLAITEERIPFLNNPNSDWQWNDVPEVHVWFSKNNPAGIEGPLTRSYEFRVDTGSCGMLIAASKLEDWDSAEGTDANIGYQYLSSSNLLYSGYWVERNVYFNRDPSLPYGEIKARVPILAVVNKTECEDYKIGVDKNLCPYSAAVELPVDKVRWMGIGFGRLHDGQPQGTPDKNPLLSIDKIRTVPVTSPGFQPGYIITPDGLTIGLTPDNYDTAGFPKHEAPLPTPSPAPPPPPPPPAGLPPRPHYPWGELPGCLKIGSLTPCLQCSVLLDTGTNKSYTRVLTGPPYIFPTRDDPTDSTAPIRQVLTAGQVVDVQFGRLLRFAGENYRVDDTTNRVTPTMVYNYHDDGRLPFVNTGNHIFRAYEVAFDPVCGTLGFVEIR